MVEIILTLAYISLVAAVLLEIKGIRAYSIDAEKIVLTMVSVWVFFILIFYKYHLDRNLKQIKSKIKKI